MKRETRVLVSYCSSIGCIALIVRGEGLDRIIAGKSCEDLCKRLRETGLIGELRYYEGMCSCGLTSFSGSTGRLDEAAGLALSLEEWFPLAFDP